MGGVRGGRAPRHRRRTCLIAPLRPMRCRSGHAGRAKCARGSRAAALAHARSRDRRRALAASGRPLPGADCRRRVTRGRDASRARRLPERRRAWRSRWRRCGRRTRLRPSRRGRQPGTGSSDLWQDLRYADPHVLEAAGVCGRGRPDAGVGHRRHHRDLQCGLRRAAEAPAVP